MLPLETQLKDCQRNIVQTSDSYDFGEDKRYCYPGSDVLINNYGIVDAEELAEAERQVSARQLTYLSNDPPTSTINLDYLKLLHKLAFEDIYPWAGEFRIVNIAKGNLFCSWEYLESQGKAIFDELASENYLLDIVDIDKMAKRLAYYLSEINVLHPFREGNGRVQRLLIQIMANSAGFDIDYSSITGDEMVVASIAAFNGDYLPMTKLMRRALAPKLSNTG